MIWSFKQAGRRSVVERDDRVLRTTRVLSMVIVPFLLVAFVVLFVFADHTKRLFAWPIKPQMSAMVLGSVYLGGAYFFVRAATVTQWHRVKSGDAFLAVDVDATDRSGDGSHLRPRHRRPVRRA